MTVMLFKITVTLVIASAISLFAFVVTDADDRSERITAGIFIFLLIATIVSLMTLIWTI